MNNTEGALHFEATLDKDQLMRMASEVEGRIRGMATNVGNEGSRMESLWKKAGLAMAGYFSFQAGQQLIRQIVNVRGEFQQLQVAFETMLNSKEKANALMQQITDLAATTPFTLQEVAQGAKQLLAYGFEAQNLTNNLRMLGDVAAGVSTDISGLVYLYGTLKTSGRVTIIDLQQFAGRGVPIFDKLSEQLGVAVSEIRSMVSEGKIGFPQVEKAFKEMTSQGGMFFNLMDKQSKTVTGQISNLQDAWSKMLNEIGKSNEGIITSGIEGLSYMVTHYQEVIQIVGTLVATYGSYKAALIAISTFEKARDLYKQISQAWQFARAMGAMTEMTKAQVAANALLNASNPFGWVALAVGAIAGLITYTSLASDKVEELTAAQKEHIKIQDEANKKIEDQKATIQRLVAEINNEKISHNQRAEALRQLNEVSGGYLKNLTLENAKTAEGKALIEQYNAQLKNKIILQANQQEIETAIKNISLIDKALKGYAGARKETAQQISEIIGKDFSIDQIKQGIENVYKVAQKTRDEEFSKIQYPTAGIEESPLIATTQDDVNKAADAYRTLISAQNDFQLQINSLQNQNVDLSKALEDPASKATDIVRTYADEISTIEDKIARLNDQKLKLPAGDQTGLNAINKQIDELQAKKNSFEGKGSKFEPLGSLSCWEAVKKKAEDAIKALQPPDTAKYADLQEKILKAQINIEKARAEISTLAPDQTKQKQALEKSIREYEQIISQSKPLVKKIELDDQNYNQKLGEFKANLYKAQAEIEKIEFDSKPFDEQLAYRKAKYEAYFLWVKFYGKDAADKQYSDLISQGNSFVEYLQKQREKLTGIDTPNAKQQVLTIDLTLEGELSVNTALDKLKKDLEQLKVESGNLVTYLSKLREKEKELVNDYSLAGLAKKDEIKREIENTKQDLIYQYDNIISDLTGFKEEYKTKLEEAQASGDNTQIEQIKSEFSAQLLRRIEGYQSVLGTITESSKTLLTETEEAIRKLVTNPGYASIRQDIEALLNRAQLELNSAGGQVSLQFITTMNQVSNILSKMGSQADDLGNRLSAAVGSLDNIQKIYKTEVKVDYTEEARPSPLKPETVPVTYDIKPANIEDIDPIIVPVDYKVDKPELPSIKEKESVKIEYDVEKPNLPEVPAVETVEVDYNVSKPDLPEIEKTIDVNVNYHIENLPGTEIPKEPNKIPVAYDITPPNIQMEKSVTVTVDTDKAKENISGLTTAMLNLANIAKAGITVNVDDREILTRLLQDYRDFTTRRKDIEQQYSDDIIVLQNALATASSDKQRDQIQQSIDLRTEDYSRQLFELEKSIADKKYVNSEYFEFLANLNRQALHEYIDDLRKRIEAEKGETEESKKNIEKLKALLGSAKAASLVGNLQMVSSILHEAAQAASELDANLGKSIDSAANLASGIANLVVGIGTGNPMAVFQGAMLINKEINGMVNQVTEGQSDFIRGLAGFATGGPMGLLSTLSEIKKERKQAEADRFKEILDNYKINDLYRQRLLDIKGINQESIEGIKEVVAKYQQALQSAQADFDGLLKIIADSMGRTGQSFDQLYEAYLTGKMGDKEKPLFEELLRLKDTIDGASNSLDEMNQKMIEVFSGTSVSSLADTIAKMFQDGTDSLYDFGKTFDDVMQSAMMSVIKTSLLMPLLTDWIKDFALDVNHATQTVQVGGQTYYYDMQGGLSLTPPDPNVTNAIFEEDKAGLLAITQQGQDYVNFLEEQMGIDFGGTGGADQLSGAIRGMTEETASVLAGQFNAMREIQGGTFESVRDSLLQLVKIEHNTRLTVGKLVEVIGHLRNIDRHTGKADSRDLGW